MVPGARKVFAKLKKTVSGFQGVSVPPSVGDYFFRLFTLRRGSVKLRRPEAASRTPDWMSLA